MAEVKIKPDEEFEKNNRSKEVLPEPQLILLSPPLAFLPASGIPTVPWDRWLHSFEQYLDCLADANLLDSTKCALLKHCLGQEGKRVYTKLLPDKTTYKAASTALTTHFGQQREMTLLENGTLTVAKTVLIGKQIEYASAQSVLLCIQNVPSNEVNSKQQVQPLAGQRRSERLKKRNSSTLTPSLFTEHGEANDYHCGGEHNHNGDDETECSEWDCDRGSDGTDQESYHDDPMDKDFTVDSDEMEDVDNCNSNDFDAASGIIQSSTKGHFCPICINRCFRGASKLARHMRSHTKDKPFSCLESNAQAASYNGKENGNSESGNEMGTNGMDGIQHLEDDVCNNDGEAGLNKTKVKELFCPICNNRSFRGAYQLARHMRSHTKDKPFSCPVCAKLFSQNYHMSRHLRKQHGEAVITKTKVKELFCPICNNLSFRGPSKLARHMRSHTKDKPFSCPVCAKLFSQNYHMRRHLRKQHGKDTYICSICRESFGSLKELQTHKQTHAAYRFACPHCDQNFPIKSVLLSHIKSHTNNQKSDGLNEKADSSNEKHCYSELGCENWATNDICSNLAESNAQAASDNGKENGNSESGNEMGTNGMDGIQHLEDDVCNNDGEAGLNKTKVKELFCPICNNRSFRGAYQLARHMRSHTKDKPFSCPVCAKLFSQNYHMSRHLRKQHGKDCLKCKKIKQVKPYSCTRCDYAFSALGELKAHMDLHNGEAPLNCPDCGKMFLNKSKLKRHMSVHTGERPHLCSICGHGFIFAASLKVHMHRHTGEKAYKCSQCTKSFATPSGLSCHSRVHMAVPPRYPCSECGRSYGRMTELKLHQRYHTGDKPYKCSCCKKCFITNYNLKVHMRIHTGERPYACSQCGQTFTQTGDRNRHMNKYH